MTFLGHAVLFIFSGFAAYLFNADRGSALALFLFVALPVAGVYFLGWIALVTAVVGFIFGGKVFWSAVRSGGFPPDE